MVKTPLTPEQQLEADHLAALLVQIAQREAPRFGELIATCPDSELLGKTEFDLRELILQRVGAAFLAAALEARKKGGTEDQASSVPTVDQTPT
jgi:hypothetical protein